MYAKLQDNGVLLEGSLLKPSMTVPGIECDDKSDPATIAKMTVQVRFVLGRAQLSRHE